MLRAFLAALFLAGMAGSATAEPGPIGRWLMNEPLTLWDWGMFKASKEAEQAAEFIGERGEYRAFAWAHYNWNHNEIEIGMGSLSYPGEASHENCNEVRRDFIRYFADFYSLENEDTARSSLHNNIASWFSHEGWERKVRDEELGKKMSRIIFAKVSLRSKDGIVACRDRITVFNAPSKPGW